MNRDEPVILPPGDLRRAFTPHEPGDDCHGEHCWGCGVDEPIASWEAPYIVCIECGHVYWTAYDLLRAYRRNLRRDWRWKTSRPRLFGTPFAPSWWAWLRHYLRASADRISFCQGCSHDF